MLVRHRMTFWIALALMLAMCLALTMPAYAQTPTPTPVPTAGADGGMATWTLTQWGDFFKAVTAFVVAIVGILTPLWLSIRGTLNKNTEVTATNTAVTAQNTVETVTVKQTVAENTLDRAVKSADSTRLLTAIAEKQGVVVPPAPTMPVIDPALVNAIADAVLAKQAAAAAVLPVSPA